MLIVLPFCKYDYDLAIALADYMTLLGPYKQHELLLVCAPEFSVHLNKIEASVGDQFAKVSVLMPTNLKHGWPIGPNTIFFTIAHHVLRTSSWPFWYMFEPDNTPLKVGWADALAAEYVQSKKLFVGVIHPTMWQRKNGSFFQHGSHLSGSCLYSKNTPNLIRLFKAVPMISHPWDVYLQWEIVPKAMHTTLIHHEWKSFNWHRDEVTGEIVGERPPNTLPPGMNTPKPLRADAVVHHGCKDGSLMNLMRASFTARKEPLEQVSLPT